MYDETFAQRNRKNTLDLLRINYSLVLSAGPGPGRRRRRVYIVPVVRCCTGTCVYVIRRTRGGNTYRTFLYTTRNDIDTRHVACYIFIYYS